MRSHGMRILVLLIILCVFVSSSISASLQVVRDGNCKSSSQIQSYLQSKSELVGNGQSVCGVNFIDCTELNDGYTICNDLLSTSFEYQPNSISLDVSSKSVISYSTFDNIHRDQYSGSHVAEFCKSIPHSVSCVIFSGNTIDESLQAYDQILRRLFADLAKQQQQEQEQLSTDSIKRVGIVISTDGRSDLNAKSLQQKVLTYLQDNDIITKNNDQVVVIAYPNQTNLNNDNSNDSGDVNEDSVVSKDSSLSLLTEFMSDSKLQLNDIAELIVTSWTKVSMNPLRKMLSNNDKLSLLKIEASYTAGIVYTENILSEWQKRVSEGKIVSNFGKRVMGLLETVQRKYRERTIGSTMSDERAEKAKLLLDSIQLATESLFKQQFQIIQSNILKKYRHGLIEQLKKDKETIPEKGQQLLRQLLFEFENDVHNIEVETFGLTLSSMKADMKSLLEAMLKDFPESPTSRLISMKHLENNVKSEYNSMNVKKKKKEEGGGLFSIRPSLSIVGMLRPPGYSNLQGYLTYATSVSSLAVDFLFGFQNDGDSPDVVGDDREIPLLRLQPKFNFDVEF